MDIFIRHGEIVMLGITKYAVASLAVAVVFSCGTAVAAPGPAANDEPVCDQGTWATKGDEKKYVCLSWRFRGQIYSLDELETVLAPLGKRVPVVLGPPTPDPESTLPRAEPPRREAHRVVDPPVPGPKSPAPRSKPRHDDDDDDGDDC